MTYSINEILDFLKEHGSVKYKENVVKLGIPKENSLGVSTIELRKLAKKIKPSNTLAKQLWDTDYHEARLLSVLIVDVSSVDPNWAISLVDDVVSWDLCDHLCKNLLFKLPEYKDWILSWQNSHKLYHKRASFVLIATAIFHEKEIKEKHIDEYLKIIRNHESDSRVHIRKAISWALREIGKRDVESYKKAKRIAEELVQSPDKNKQWVGKDALKEINQLVVIKDSERLVSKTSKMGKLGQALTKTSC